MKVLIVGTGTVGEASACLLTHAGHEVYGYDPIRRSSQYYRVVPELTCGADVVLVCTPEDAVGEVVKQLARLGFSDVVVRSSTKPGTVRSLQSQLGICLSHWPEFVRERTHLQDALNAAFFVVGLCGPRGDASLQLFRGLERQRKVVYTDSDTSEAVKLFLNCYLANLVTFWCEVDEISSAAGIDSREVARIMSLDVRVSCYGFDPIGCGFSGRCLPKDLRQVIAFAKAIGVNPEVFEAIDIYNAKKRRVT